MPPNLRMEFDDMPKNNSSMIGEKKLLFSFPGG